MFSGQQRTALNLLCAMMVGPTHVETMTSMEYVLRQVCYHTYYLQDDVTISLGFSSTIFIPSTELHRKIVKC